jgi:hypothetical protein
MKAINMLKTITDHNVRKKAIHNLLIQHNKEVICRKGLFKIDKNTCSTSILMALCKFSYFSSKEGQKYWENIYYNYEKRNYIN